MLQDSFEDSFKAKLKETFKFVIDFFHDNDLKWWTAGGTMLGAIRHNDIIPWDDDIDIMMPREDYNRLIALKDKLKGTKYVLLTPNDEDYWMCSAKICDWNTTIIETPHDLFPLGVFVDIFPLDKFDYSKEIYIKQYAKYKKIADAFRLAMTRYSFKEALSDIKSKHFGALRSGLRSLLYSYNKRNDLRRAFLRIEQQFNQGEGMNTASPTGAYGTREFFDSEWFDETIEVPFGDYLVKVPKDYDKYLKVMYGDYLQLPPEDQRVTHHGQYYIDLDKHISWEEFKQ